MLIAAAPRTDRARRHVYGAAVGIVAATTAMASHCALMSDETPSAGILVMLLIGCAAIGALTSSARPTADRPYTVAAALLVAQILGHLTLATGSGHAFAAPSPTMVGAHAIALLVGVAVVRRADRAVQAALAALHRLVRAVTPAPLPLARPWAVVTAERAPLFDASTARHHIRRGPPVIAAVCS